MESREGFIERRMNYHKAMLHEQHKDVPESALDYWARDAADKEWRTGRVYADPVSIERATVNVYDPKATFTSGKAQGINMRFNPGGPMVSIMSVSDDEALEIVQGMILILRSKGRWPIGEDDPDF